MIEKGMTPRDLFPDKRPVSPEDCLRRGIIMLFLGIGPGTAYFILLRTSWGPSAWLCGVAGVIVGFLGLGYLIYYPLARKHIQKNSATAN